MLTLLMRARLATAEQSADTVRYMRPTFVWCRIGPWASLLMSQASVRMWPTPVLGIPEQGHGAAGHRDMLGILGALDAVTTQRKPRCVVIVPSKRWLQPKESTWARQTRLCLVSTLS